MYFPCRHITTNNLTQYCFSIFSPIAITFHTLYNIAKHNCGIHLMWSELAYLKQLPHFISKLSIV